MCEGESAELCFYTQVTSLMSSQGASFIRSYAVLLLFYVEWLCIQISALPKSE